MARGAKARGGHLTTTLEESEMRKTLLFLLAVSSLPACAYGDMVVHPNGKIYVQRHDRFLFGALRKMYECTPDGAGNVTCVDMAGKP
jgi:hypothetical protein